MGCRTLLQQTPPVVNWGCRLTQVDLYTTATTTTVLRPFFRDYPGKPVPEENFWTLWCKRRLTEAGTLTIRLGATPSELTSAHLHHPPYFLQARCPSCRPINSVKAPKARHRLTYIVVVNGCMGVCIRL